SVLLGDQDNSLAENTPVNYREINDSLVDSVVGEYNAFIKLFFDLNAKINFSREFGMNPGNLETHQNLLQSKAREYLLIGIEQKLEELEEDGQATINESLFFYPLIGGINRLAYAIAEGLQVKN